MQVKSLNSIQRGEPDLMKAAGMDSGGGKQISLCEPINFLGSRVYIKVRVEPGEPNSKP